jgi:hypothetical protein
MASVTLWTRLEPHPRDGSMQRSLQAQVRDPLWMLARQWQIGEFQGEDAGSPVQATMSVQSQPLTGYAPNDTGAGLLPYDPAVPLEPHVERVPVTLNVRGSAQLGRHAEMLIRAAVPPATADTVITAVRAAYPISATAPADAPEDARGRAMRASLAGRVVDGLALASAYSVGQAGGTPVPPLPPETSLPGVPAALAALVAYRASLYSEPAGDDAWRSRQLDYAATVTSTVAAPGAATSNGAGTAPAAGTSTTTLVAGDFRGGDLDWFSFSLTTPQSGQSPVPEPGPAPPAATVSTFNFLPTHVTFRGMPSPRWWELEDSVTDFGALAPDQVDLATMLVMEFALVFGNDWFCVPVPAQVGSLSQVTTLVVTDTFGIRTVIEPTEQLAQPEGSGGPWSMFKISGAGGARSPFIMIPPSCGVVMEGQPLEDVYFLRDDMAALCWAVEHQLQGPLDAPVDALQLAFDFDAAFAPPPLPNQVPGGPAQTYLLENPVPANWIPMVPVVSPTGARYFRRGVMVRPGYGDVHAAARLLQPQQPLFVADESIPREGADVTRYFRRTRWTDGSTVTWLAHRNRPGRGPGWSGLAFDLVRPLPPAPS